MLTADNLCQLRAYLIEHGELIIERQWLRQVGRYLRAQQIGYAFSPAAGGIRVTLASSQLVR